MRIDTTPASRPMVCNLCGGFVIYVSNAKIYGREYGNGKAYLCTHCGAYVGTHPNEPTYALGILADAPMREMKRKCHDLFDRAWVDAPTSKERGELRREAYKNLAEKLGIPRGECHFGWFDMPLLERAYEALKNCAD